MNFIELALLIVASFAMYEGGSRDAPNFGFLCGLLTAAYLVWKLL